MRFSVKQIGIVTLGIAAGFALVFAETGLVIRAPDTDLRPGETVDIFYELPEGELSFDMPGFPYTRLAENASVVRYVGQDVMVRVTLLTKIRVSLQELNLIAVPNGPGRSNFFFH